MRFLFIAPRFHTNQVSWIESLIKNNHIVDFHSQFRGEIENYEHIEPLIFEPCGFSKLIVRLFGNGGVNNPRGFPNPISYYKELRKLQPDVIIVRDVSRWFSLLGALLGRCLQKKIIIYSQTELYKKYTPVRTIQTKIILFILKAIWITPIKGNTSIYNSHPDKLNFVPFSVDIQKKQISEIKNPFKLLSVGKFEDRKNQLMLLKVFKKLLNQGFKVKLSLIGEVSKDVHKENFNKCNQYIIDNGLQDSVEILVNLSHDNMASYYQNSDLFILPATEEPASISVLESIGMGTPAICSDTNGTRFYLTENKFGLTFVDNDIESLYSTIKLVLNPIKLKFYNENISTRVDNVLSQSVFYDTFIGLVGNGRS